MHVLSNDRTIQELIRYFSLFDASLSKTPETRHIAESLQGVMEKLKLHGAKTEEAELRQLVMRAKMTVCIFFLRKTVITLGKEIRKAELAIKSIKFYDDLLPHLPPGNQMPLALQMQKFMEMIENALSSFHKIPDSPKCETVLAQRESLEYWLGQAKALLEESRLVNESIRSVRAEFQTLQKEVHGAVQKMRKELLSIFEYNIPDVNQYFLTITV